MKILKKLKIQIILLIPVTALSLICVFVALYIIQQRSPNEPPSALLNKDMPKFFTKSLYNENIALSSDNLKRNVTLSEDENIYSSSDNLTKKYTLINFFASWCAPCKVEHPLFFILSEDFPNLFLLGINYKDKKEDAISYLKKDGNPYNFVGLDKEGRLGLEFGVIGLPETFIINNEGKIIYKRLGPLNKKIIKNEITPLLR